MMFAIVDAHSKYIVAHIVNAATSSATITKLRQTFVSLKAVSLKYSVD